jgi:RNA polymerase sigma factor (sigma-70 family)
MGLSRNHRIAHLAPLFRATEPKIDTNCAMSSFGDSPMAQLAAAAMSLVGLACALRFDGARPPTAAGALPVPDDEPRDDPHQDERAWMTAYAAGDDMAFNALFKSLAPRLLAFFMRAIPDRALAEDLLQSTFVRLHAARHTYRVGSPVRPWVFTIAARVRIDELRRRRRLPRAAPEAELDRLEAAADPESEGRGLDGDARGRSVREAIDSLPESQRLVVHLHRFEELSYAQIGAVLGVSEGAARIRAFRAYAKLRELLLPLLAEEPPA